MSARYAEIAVAQFCDSNGYIGVLSFFECYPPNEIVLPITAMHSLLHTTLQIECPNVRLTVIGRKYFNDTQGALVLDHIVRDSCSAALLDKTSHYLALAAVHALIKSIEGAQNVAYAANSVSLRLVGAGDSMLLDRHTVAGLELLRNASTGHTKGSLLSYLSRTRTPMGARALRTAVLQPPLSVSTIQARQNCVNELLLNEKRFYSVCAALDKMADLDAVVAGLARIHREPTDAHCRAQITHLLQLRGCLLSVRRLADALQGVEEELLAVACALFKSDCPALVESRIQEVLSEEFAMNRATSASGHARSVLVMAVRPGINGLLDVARTAYTEAVQDLHEHYESLRSALDGGKLRLEYSSRRGYFLSVPAGRGASAAHGNRALPPGALQVCRTGRRITCTTPEISALNSRIRESLSEIHVLTARTVEDTIVFVRAHAAALASIAETIGLLDMLMSFAELVTLANGSLVRPVVSNARQGPLAIRGGRHPTLSLAQGSDMQVTPNDTWLASTCRVRLVMGPNMAGKSVYLRQTALILLLAQIGAFVPAVYVEFSPVDRVLAHFSRADAGDPGCSSFFQEMRDAAFLLHSATPASLVLVDELGRGTAHSDGSAISWAITEGLRSSGCRALIATHFPALRSMAAVYPDVALAWLPQPPWARARPGNQHSPPEDSVEPSQESTPFQVSERPPDGPCSYGIAAARASSMPPEVVDAAADIALRIASRSAALGGTSAYDGNGSCQGARACQLPLSACAAAAQRVLALRAADLLPRAPAQARAAAEQLRAVRELLVSHGAIRHPTQLHG